VAVIAFLDTLVQCLIIDTSTSEWKLWSFEDGNSGVQHLTAVRGAFGSQSENPCFIWITVAQHSNLRTVRDRGCSLETMGGSRRDVPSYRNFLLSFRNSYTFGNLDVFVPPELDAATLADPWRTVAVARSDALPVI